MSSSVVTHPPPPHSPSTLMLPYGYQIDLDFIKYCENLSQPDQSDVELQRRQRRRQRQSMEVMLGIQLEMQSQMDELSEIWERKPPEPPPRTHHHLRMEMPIVPNMKHQRRQKELTSWDRSLNDVVDDFEKTLERSKKGKDRANRSRAREEEEVGDCIPHKHQLPKHRHVSAEPPSVHVPVEAIDVALSDHEAFQSRVRDLEEQSKLIPLLQIQIQALREERKQLQAQLTRQTESRASSTSSSSPNPQPVFQAQRVSPVSLNAIKMAPIPPKRSNRSMGTNTSLVLHRDVGCSPDSPGKMIPKAVSTDFMMKTEGDGGRLYSEKDLKKAIEMAHAKMRKTSTTIGTQFGENEKAKPQLRSVACGNETLTRNASVGTDEQNLTMISIGGITIAPEVVAPVPIPAARLSEAPALSLRDLNKLPVTRTNATQTLSPMVHQQGTQSSPLVISKATDSNDLIRLAHKTSMTEMSQKRDQVSHTADLVKVTQAGTNTPQPVVPLTRSTASNTSAVAVKSVGVNCETQVETNGSPLNHSNSSSKIPRPSPMPQRKFVRQETFTVATLPTEVKECPAELMLKLTMTQSNHHSPVPSIESPAHTDFAAPAKDLSPDSPMRKSPSIEPVELSSPINEEPIEPSKMPMSPSIEYLDDDDYDEDEMDEDKFNDELVASSIPLRPPPTSISTIRLCQQNRVKIKPTKEMIAALKVLNDHLQKSPEPDEEEIKTAREVASCEWFRISSTDTAISDNVEDYLDYFEEQSWELLTYMVNLADKNGNTAMHYAVSHGNFDVVSILLDTQVSSINQTNNAGYTCVMLVSLAKILVPEHKTVVQRLFKLADVNIRATKNSQTALMLAVSHGNGTIAQMLVEASADINIQDDDGSTSLMCASEHGHLDIVKFLLAQPDCDSTRVDVDGNTALKISLEAGYHDIGCLLYAHEHLLRSKTTLKRTPSSMKSSTSSLN